MEKDQIVEKLIEARNVYYNDETALMSDSEFDELEEQLRKLDKNHSYFSTVGIESDSESSKEKIVHKTPMLSMGKAKTINQIEKWIKKLQLPEDQLFCMQPKIDGLSATCFYNEGKLQYVATRGDGQVGQDISHIAQFIDDIKESISFSTGEVEIRGELYLPKNTLYDTKGKPLRNNCVGLINRKEGKDDLKFVRFVTYQINGDHRINSESGKIELLNREGFHTITFSRISSIEEIDLYYKEYIDSKRDQWLYETDGLIIAINNNQLHQEIDSRWVVDHHHHYAIAFKPPAAFKETHLKNIEWQVSRQGNLIPVAIFNPIVLGGATLERASLHNHDFVQSLLLKVQDTLLIERANDVIPYVRDNKSSVERDALSFTSDLIPSICPSCSSLVESSGVHITCNNPLCPEQLIQKIIYWVREADMEQVSIGTIRALFEYGKIRKISDIYNLTEEDFENLEGFGEKKIANFVKQVKKSKELTPRELISRLGIPLVQQKALKKLNINKIEDFLNFDDDTYVIGQNIIQWISLKKNITYLNELLDVVQLKEIEEEDFAGSVAMTGKGPLPRKEIISLIEKMGYEFSSNVSAETNILLCEDPGSGSSKLKKAEKLGVTLLSYEEFITK